MFASSSALPWSLASWASRDGCAPPSRLWRMADVTDWTSSSKFSGLRRKSIAPWRMACTPVRNDARPLTTITGMPG